MINLYIFLRIWEFRRYKITLHAVPNVTSTIHFSISVGSPNPGDEISVCHLYDQLSCLIRHEGQKIRQ